MLFNEYKRIVLYFLLVKSGLQPDRAQPGMALQAISADAVMREVGFQVEKPSIKDFFTGLTRLSKNTRPPVLLNRLTTSDGLEQSSQT